MTKNLKVTVVGDGLVGKTCLLSTYVENRFPVEYAPTVFENYNKEIIVDGTKDNVTIWDTAGQEDYERLRPLTYPHTSCFLICFSVEKTRASYDNVHTKWVPEVRHFNPQTPIVLVATKIDLRDDPSKNCYTTKEGEKLRRKIKAQSYRECSAKELMGLQEVFEEAVRVHRHNTRTKKTVTTSCQIL